MAARSLAPLSAVAFFHDPELSSPDPGALGTPQKGKAALFQPDFNATAQYSVSQGLADCGLYALQCVFIDNSLSPAPTVLQFVGTNQIIYAPPFSQGYYRVLAGNTKLELTATNYATLNALGLNNAVPIQLLNLMPEGADAWPAVSPYGMQGTPFAFSSQGANSILTAIAPAIAGRRTFLTGFSLTGAGATSALVVNATLSGIDNGLSGNATLNFAFTFPNGVANPAQPIIGTFNPQLPVQLGQNAVLTLPAGGAGNTNAAISMTGFYQ